MLSLLLLPLLPLLSLLSLLSLLALSHPLTPTSHQQTCPAAPPPDPPTSTPTSALFHLSCLSPLSSTLSPHTSLLSPLLTHIAFIDLAVTTAARQSRQTDLATRLTTCNSRAGEEWAKGTEDYFGARNWGTLNRGCVSTVYGAGERDGVVVVDDQGLVRGGVPQGVSSEDIYADVLAHAETVNGVAREVGSKLGGVWDGDKTSRGWEFKHVTRTQSCSNDYVGFVRRGGVWFVAERVTNDHKDVTLGTNARLFAHEYVRVVEGGKVDSLEMVLKRKNGTEWLKGSTAVSERTGAVTGSEFVEVFQPNNLAVLEALKRGSHQTQQASDATTPSNIAILALPLAMNLVPVALIADVNSLGMLVYTLLTDVLTTIPLAIKGVEVISIGASSNIAVVTRITGGNLWSDADRDKDKAAETWVAECRANGNLTLIGVILLTVAIVFMIGGIAAEILAKRFVKRVGKVVGESSTPGESSSGALAAPQAAALVMGAGWRGAGSAAERKSE